MDRQLWGNKSGPCRPSTPATVGRKTTAEPLVQQSSLGFFASSAGQTHNHEVAIAVGWRGGLAAIYRSVARAIAPRSMRCRGGVAALMALLWRWPVARRPRSWCSRVGYGTVRCTDADESAFEAPHRAKATMLMLPSPTGSFCAVAAVSIPRDGSRGAASGFSLAFMGRPRPRSLSLTAIPGREEAVCTTQALAYPRVNNTPKLPWDLTG